MTSYGTEPAPTREEIDNTQGALLLEFGRDWCGFCQAAEPFINEALSKSDPIRHIKVEDGPGRKLGRSFKIKLWPTLIFLKDGKEISRVVRPASPGEISDSLVKLGQAA